MFLSSREFERVSDRMSCGVLSAVARHLLYVTMYAANQSLSGKPNRPQRHPHSTTLPEAATTPETLLPSVTMHPRRHKNGTKSYERHSSIAEMTSSGPTATPLPLELRALLHVCI